MAFNGDDNDHHNNLNTRIYKSECEYVSAYVCVMLGSVGVFFGVRARYYAAAQEWGNAFFCWVRSQADASE
jgi:hypothetical protein